MLSASLNLHAPKNCRERSSGSLATPVVILGGLKRSTSTFQARFLAFLRPRLFSALARSHLSREGSSKLRTCHPFLLINENQPTSRGAGGHHGPAADPGYVNSVPSAFRSLCSLAPPESLSGKLLPLLTAHALVYANLPPNKLPPSPFLPAHAPGYANLPPMPSSANGGIFDPNGPGYSIEFWCAQNSFFMCINMDSFAATGERDHRYCGPDRTNGQH